MPVRTSVYLLSGYSPSCQEDGWLEIRGDRFGGEDRLTLVMTWWTGRALLQDSSVRALPSREAPNLLGQQLLGWLLGRLGTFHGFNGGGAGGKIPLKSLVPRRGSDSVLYFPHLYLP